MASTDPLSLTLHPPSETTQNLIALSQDIAALLSLSLEATASLVHDLYRRTLSTVGFGEVVRYERKEGKGRGEAGRGLAVVVVGANEATGHSLTLHLAKSGYAVFPLVPLPSPSSPPTSAALSSLLLSWSSIQKRLRARYPYHPGTVVPVITDPESPHTFWPSKAKIQGRYAHAGETVRAYCRENKLTLVAIVCAARGTQRPEKPYDMPTPVASPPSGRKLQLLAHDDSPASTPPTQLPPSAPTSPLLPSVQNIITLPPVPRPTPSGLVMTDENTLISLYRANILDPLSVVRELSDILSTPASEGRGKGRVIFVNGGQGIGVPHTDEVAEDDERVDSAMRIIGAARGEAARLLRSELGPVGIDVCEVVVGPMAPRVGAPEFRIRRCSDESHESDRNGRYQRKIGEKESDVGSKADVERKMGREAILAQRLSLLSQVWAVDDALLFSAVRRAIQDRYPRYRHHAGISPFIASIAEITPGSGMIKVLGRWLVGRLLMGGK